MDNTKINILESKIKKSVIKLKILISKKDIYERNTHTKNSCLSQLSAIYSHVNAKNNLEDIATNEIPMLICSLINIGINRYYIIKSLESLSNMIYKYSKLINKQRLCENNKKDTLENEIKELKNQNKILNEQIAFMNSPLVPSQKVSA